MADQEQSPFDFSRVPGSDTFGALKREWDGFLEQPGARTALLQFGINMMQPPSFGDTAFSQMGRAIGAAGEATTNQQVIEQKMAESEAKSELAQARAAHAGERAGYQAENLELRRSEGAAKRSLQELMNVRSAYTAYLNREQNAFKASHAQWQDLKKSFDLGVGKDPGPEPVMKPPIPLREFQKVYGYEGVGPGPEDERLPASSTPASSDLTGRGVPEGAILEVKTPKELEALPAGTKYSRPGDPPGSYRTWQGKPTIAPAAPAAAPVVTPPANTAPVVPRAPGAPLVTVPQGDPRLFPPGTGQSILDYFNSPSGRIWGG